MTLVYVFLYFSNPLKTYNLKPIYLLLYEQNRLTNKRNYFFVLNIFQPEQMDRFKAFKILLKVANNKMKVILAQVINFAFNLP